MTERKILFRGFHPCEDGNTIIRINGEEFRGDFVFWDEFGRLKKSIFPLKFHVDEIYVIPETVGQWVKTDKNGKDLFDGDIVTYTNNQDGTYQIGEEMTGVISYESDGCYWYSKNNFQHHNDWAYADDIELIGNKWESEVTE